MSVPTFVVGTGRCGSTMLSNMLRDHPHVLSLSEFFSIVTDAGRRPDAYATEPMSGSEFWAILADCAPRNNFAMRYGIASPELLYPCTDPGARFSADTGIPSICIAVLPHLTDDHDRLYELLRAEVADWPVASAADHYRRLFGWLADRFGKRMWVERSGSSLYLVEQLMQLFPDARFVHLARDGRDAVLSMQAHFGFRLGFVMAVLTQALGVDPIVSADRSRLDQVPEELRPLLPERFDPDAFRAFLVPLPVLGSLWSQQVETGLKALSILPSDRLLTLRYEDVLADPKRQLDAFAAFLGEEAIDGEWSARCAASIRPPRSSWRDLPDEIADAITEACLPGFEQLRTANVVYDF